MTIGTVHPNDYPTTGGYPFLNISRWCRVPYSDVLKFADQCAVVYEEYKQNPNAAVNWPKSDTLNPTCRAEVIAWTVVEQDRKHRRGRFANEGN